MPKVCDGPASELFEAVRIGGVKPRDLAEEGVPADMAAAAAEHGPEGRCVCWGIPFDVLGAHAACRGSFDVKVKPLRARWLVFLHTADVPQDGDWRKLGRGLMGDLAAEYLVRYEDGSEQRLPVRRRWEVGSWQKPWGDNPVAAVGWQKPRPVRASHEQTNPMWGWSQTRVQYPDGGPFTCWLWAWPNPRPSAKIAGLRIEPVHGVVLLFGMAAGRTVENPLRWRRRRKAVLTLPPVAKFDPRLDERGLLRTIQIDLGQVICACPRRVYPLRDWENTRNNDVPAISEREILIEYASHPEAVFHLECGRRIRVADLENRGRAGPMIEVRPAERPVTLRIVEKESGRPVAAKLHVHGEAGEYLAPVDRHRIANDAWFEDYSADFVHQGLHQCAYINGQTSLLLPIGKVYIEVAKGFEIRPLRLVRKVGPATREIVIALEKVLPWREKGWVTADTHVHFLSPQSARLEGAAEGVNIVNLLASQWGELMTNVGDFDGESTIGSKEAGGDGEWLVRVGTENRQHVLGHISLLGYRGPIIAPMTTGGPDESALGDPVGKLLTEWAVQCRRQGGIVVLPHFPNPRTEHAAAIVSGNVDGVEMTSWGSLYAGIDPYSLVDWYRYLNCGYMVAAVGGTDKMSANTAVGTVRTYARIADGMPFTYEEWKNAVRRAETFVTYGPLLEFRVNGRPCGSRLKLGRKGGTVDVEWEVASVTVPMTSVELIVNGEVRERQSVAENAGRGCWRIPVTESSWMALLVRGRHPGMPEIVAAHSSPVMAHVDGTIFHSAADAVSILEQIEGALAYLDTVGTKAETARLRQMRLFLISCARGLHNRLHARGEYHHHLGPFEHSLSSWGRRKNLFFSDIHRHK